MRSRAGRSGRAFGSGGADRSIRACGARRTRGASRAGRSSRAFGSWRSRRASASRAFRSWRPRRSSRPFRSRGACRSRRSSRAGRTIETARPWAAIVAVGTIRARRAGTASRARGTRGTRGSRRAGAHLPVFGLHAAACARCLDHKLRPAAIGTRGTVAGDTRGLGVALSGGHGVTERRSGFPRHRRADARGAWSGGACRRWGRSHRCRSSAAPISGDSWRGRRRCAAA